MEAVKKKAGRPKKAAEVTPVEEVTAEDTTNTAVMEEAPAAIVKENDYEYFADFDKGSSMPAWTLTRNIDMLENEVNSYKQRIAHNEIPLEEVEYAKADLKRKEERLELIKNSSPELTGRQIDVLKEKRDKLADEISRSKFTRYEMEKGLADPHEEADRMTGDCIPVDREEARRCKVIPDSNGKTSRNQAIRMWKIMCSRLGDTPMNPNAEILRKDMGNSKRGMMAVPDLSGINMNR